MEAEPILWFTALLNRLLAGPVNALLRALNIPAGNPHEPIPNYVAMQILVALIIIVLFSLLRARLSMDRPGGLQHILEVGYDYMREMAEEVIGHHGRHYVPMVLTLGIFILFCNLIGLIPSFLSPTASPEVTLGCALVAFCYYHFEGARHQGVLRYIKHFGGPIWWLSPLMFPIEIVSHFGRPLSLTVRLFANIFAGDLITVIFFSLVPIGVPMIFLGLHTFVSFLQAYIFMLLTLIYLQGATAEEH